MSTQPTSATVTDNADERGSRLRPTVRWSTQLTATTTVMDRPDAPLDPRHVQTSSGGTTIEAPAADVAGAVQRVRTAG
jgi:hypothetical protein